MRVALLELPARFGAIDEALAEVEHLVLGEGAAPADLVLLPEASLTGYVSPNGSFDVRPFGEPIEGPTRRAMAVIARRANAAIAFPLIEQAGKTYFNSFLLLAPSGDLIGHYRKIHPWYPESWATPGDLPMPIATVKGTRVSVAVCFDIHFLEIERREALRSIDLLLFPSAWVDEGEDDSRAPILGRIAAAFGITIANANWGGGAPMVSGQGSSRFVGPDGVLVALDGVVQTARRLDWG